MNKRSTLLHFPEDIGRTKPNRMPIWYGARSEQRISLTMQKSTISFRYCPGFGLYLSFYDLENNQSRLFTLNSNNEPKEFNDFLFSKSDSDNNLKVFNSKSPQGNREYFKVIKRFFDRQLMDHATITQGEHLEKLCIYSSKGIAEFGFIPGGLLQVHFLGSNYSERILAPAKRNFLDGRELEGNQLESFKYRGEIKIDQISLEMNESINLVQNPKIQEEIFLRAIRDRKKFENYAISA